MRILVSIFFVMYATTSYANIVEQAQRLLTHLGYNVGVIDGLYGGKTERALTDFYNTQGAKYDGKLDQNEITDLLANFPNKINYCFDEHTSSSGENHTESNFLVDDLFTRQITSIPFYQRGTFGSKTSKTDELEVDAIITSVADVNLDGIDDLLIEYIETMVPPLIMLGTKDGTFNRLGNVDLNSARRHIREGYFKDINDDGWKAQFDQLENLPITFNAFPMDVFHGERVKEKVYNPDWSHMPRLEYTKKVGMLGHYLGMKDFSISSFMCLCNIFN